MYYFLDTLSLHLLHILSLPLPDIYQHCIQIMIFCMHASIDSDSVSGVQMIGITPFGSTIGAMAMVVVTVIITFILITTILLKSKRALRMDHERMRAKLSEQSAIYEELDKVMPTPPSPTIDIEQNSAYISIPALAY